MSTPALRGKPAPLAEDAKGSVKVKVAPLTVTANPQQKLAPPEAMGGILWHWQREPWSDPEIGSGVWAVRDFTSWLDAVRVRVSEDWPVRDDDEFTKALSEAMRGRRLPNLQDLDRVKSELASAPIGPTEDLATTVTAQLGGLVTAQ